MGDSWKDVAEKALSLPVDDRVSIAESILLTLDEEHDLRVDEAIFEELERRKADLEAGRAELIPAEEVFQRIRSKLKCSE